MFSFAGDTILDPFVGTGSTSIAAVHCGRNSIGNEIDATYLEMAKDGLTRAMAQLKLVGLNEPDLAEISST